MNLNEEFQFQETLKDQESFNNQRLEKYIVLNNFRITDKQQNCR